MKVIHLVFLGSLPALRKEKELISSSGLGNAGFNILIIYLLHRNHCATVTVMFWFLASKVLQWIGIFSKLCSILECLWHRAVQSPKKSSGKQSGNLDEFCICRNWQFPDVFLLLPMHSYRTAEYIIKGKGFICLFYVIPWQAIQRCPTEVRKRWGGMSCDVQSWVMVIFCSCEFRSEITPAVCTWAKPPHPQCNAQSENKWVWLEYYPTFPKHGWACCSWQNCCLF